MKDMLREKGRPAKWVKATVGESVWLGRSGITFRVWEKWMKKRRKLGTLTVLMVTALVGALSVPSSSAERVSEERTVPELVGVLQNERDPQKRSAALWALGKRPSQEVVAAITDAAAKDPDGRVQKDALSLIGKIGFAHPDLVGQRQISLAEKLLGPAANAAEHVHEQAAASYVALRGKAAIPKLLEALSGEQSPRVRRAILNRGDKFWDALEKTPDVLASAALRDPDPVVASFAARALADTGDARAVETLTLYLKKAPSRKEVALLGRLGRSPRVSLETFARTIEPWLKETPVEAYAALRAVSDPRRQAVQPILADLALKLLPHLPPDQKHKAFEFIGDTGALGHLPILAEGDDPKRL
jgi:HEAT repeat protein